MQLSGYIFRQVYSENAITDIASLPGYSDPSHFARAFRRLAGVSPREYLMSESVQDVLNVEKPILTDKLLAEDRERAGVIIR